MKLNTFLSWIHSEFSRVLPTTEGRFSKMTFIIPQSFSRYVYKLSTYPQITSALFLFPVTCQTGAATLFSWLLFCILSFSYILGRMGKLEDIDVGIFCAAAMNFYRTQVVAASWVSYKPCFPLIWTVSSAFLISWEGWVNLKISTLEYFLQQPWIYIKLK